MTKRSLPILSPAEALAPRQGRARPTLPGATRKPEPRPSAEGLYDPANEKDNCGVGFIAHLKGERSHDIVAQALYMLTRMDHRGACGCEPNTGDGAGILTALPAAFLRRVAADEAGIALPEEAGAFGAGNFFLPTDGAQREACREAVQRIVAEEGQQVLGWRDLPVDPQGADVGPSARATQPAIQQLFVGASEALKGDDDGFERTLYIIRKRVTHAIRGDESLPERDAFYACSLSSRLMIYKGQLTAGQVPLFYPDLRDPRYTSHLAMVHSRFSTNTFPSWDRAQPCRWMSHNGEINTLKGNVNWLRARQGLLRSRAFGDQAEAIERLMPVIEEQMSDSGTFDNAFELLMMSGRSLPEAIMMMIPEAWENHESMNPAKRAFYEFHANLMEPWDGPASISFTDGRSIGAVLDRNGLRPSRYYVTDDDRVIMASEVGVVDVAPQRVVSKGRLEPGRMFLVDFEQGRIVPDEEVKRRVASARPYGQWLENQRTELADLPGAADGEAGPMSQGDRIRRMRALGYTTEHLSLLLKPMAQDRGKEALGSMGNDQALAVLSDKPRLIYDYFKQMFAQVTNPPIDPIREEIIMSLGSFIGPEGNLLDTNEDQCRRLYLPQPILTNAQLAAVRGLGDAPHRGWTSRVIDITYESAGIGCRGPGIGQNTYGPRDWADAGHPTPDTRSDEEQALGEALDRICEEASQAIAEGVQLVILSDRGVSADRVPISSLLAVGAVHHHLVRNQDRTKLGIVLETGEAREVHHFACLFGFGVDAVNPYLAFEAVRVLRDEGVIERDMSDERVIGNYVKSLGKGLLKVMSKMGISTLASYKGAQIFECVGLNQRVIDLAFVGTASRLKGAGLGVLAAEAHRRHALGYPERGEGADGGASARSGLTNPGEYYWRPGGDRRGYNPQTIANLQLAARANSRGAYEQYASACNDDARSRCTLRGLIRVREWPRGQGAEGSSEGRGQGTKEPGRQVKNKGGDTTPHSAPGPLGPSAPPPTIDLEAVEPAAAIVKRFRTGAMSLGSLSKEAHETLALAMNRMGGMSNSGEGGEDPARFKTLGNGDSKRSAIKQIASGRFGVTSWYIANADRLQIKIAQGAKPGEGGQLPGFKVNDYIARIRYSIPGVGLISPPPHHDIYSIEDLAQLIFDLKNANPDATVSVKLVAEVGVGTVAAGVAKAHADHILVSGHDGGTGASPLTSIKHAGLPWELGVAEAHQTLVLNDLRSRVRLETDGGMKTGKDVFIAACLGAEEYGFSTAPMIATGCIMMRKCHLNTCPVGVCTQDPALRKKFTGQPEHVINYLFLVAEELRKLMASVGVRSLDELIGRVDLLEPRAAIEHWKADGLDLAPILAPARRKHDQVGVRCLVPQDHGLDKVLDNRLIERARPAIDRGEAVRFVSEISNVDRAVGTMLSHRVSRQWGEAGLPDDTIAIDLAGSAGQSLGAWLASGVTIRLEGDANDYLGKGLSGGKLIVYPPRDAAFVPEDNVIIGNVALYGATAGQCYVRGVAAERFAVRNSGAHAVVEGVGDHGCEYMTGGRVVVLGPTGRNFAAGMSGGVAYVHDPENALLARCNLGMVELENLDDPDDRSELRQLIENHQAHTGSTLASDLLARWDKAAAQFVKVMPIDYRRVLDQLKQRQREEDMPEVGHG